MTALSGAASITVQPEIFRDSLPLSGIPYSSYNVVYWTFLSYSKMMEVIADYEALMLGHPGHDNGAPERMLGTGVEWGIDESGVQWWLTEVEGLTDSPTWEIRSEEPAVGDGTWVLDVRAPGREITLKGVLIAETSTQLAEAMRSAVATLSAKPRTGWLEWDDKQIPVALMQQTKVKHVGSLSAEVEMVFKGIDAGTAGAGVYLESTWTQSWELVSTVDQTAVVGGTVPCSPTIVMVGPLDLGAVITVGPYQMITTAELVEGDTAVVNCRTRLVTINDTLSRGFVTLQFDRWPVMSTDDIRLNAVYAGGGHIIVQATALWG